ncbi:MAG TPA: hypothetical protein VHE37_05040 [Nevskiaceae bacterium]|nr:hypothetical protein [Nevskiaceae bacterium]
MSTAKLLPLLLAGLLASPLVRADGASDLHARYGQSTQRLHDSPFHRPLYLESQEESGKLQGEVYAEIEHPFAQVQQVLSDPQRWCEVLLLQPNVKQCRALEGGSKLAVNLGRRFDQPIEKTYAAEFTFHPPQKQSDYFAVQLDAAKGPVGTHDYRIAVEAMPVGSKTFLHLAYAYGYGMTARLATQAYFSTSGSGKVGFTVAGKSEDGTPAYVTGLRGAVERNAMRYYLAIEAHLAVADTPQPQRFEQSLQRWFDSIEQYARQLKEDDRNAYVTVKRGEYQRQQQAQQG